MFNDVFLKNKPVYFPVFNNNMSMDLSWVAAAGALNYVVYDPENVKDLYKKVDKSKIKKDACLYFLKSTQFPRTRLVNTKFTRCNKIDKADYVVIDTNRFESNYYYGLGSRFSCGFIETEKSYYVLDKNWYYSYRSPAGQEYSRDPAAFIIKYGFLPKDDNIVKQKLILKGFRAASAQIYSDMEILFKLKIPAISVDDLVSEVDEQSEKMDEDGLRSIVDMLSSSDSSVQSLGLKLLGNYDITEIAPFIRYIISSNSSLQNCSAWNSTGVKSLRNNIGFRYFNNNSNIIYRYDNLELPENTAAANILKEYVTKETIKGLNSIVNDSLKRSLDTLGLKLNITIENVSK